MIVILLSCNFTVKFHLFLMSLIALATLSGMQLSYTIVYYLCEPAGSSLHSNIFQ